MHLFPTALSTITEHPSCRFTSAWTEAQSWSLTHTFSHPAWSALQNQLLAAWKSAVALFWQLKVFMLKTATTSKCYVEISNLEALIIFIYFNCQTVICAVDTSVWRQSRPLMWLNRNYLGCVIITWTKLIFFTWLCKSTPGLWSVYCVISLLTIHMPHY